MSKKKSKSEAGAAEKAVQPGSSSAADAGTGSTPGRETPASVSRPEPTPVQGHAPVTGPDRDEGPSATASPAMTATGSSTQQGREPETNPHRPGFLPEVLDSTVIARPLLKELDQADKNAGENVGPPEPIKIIIDLNLEYPNGRDACAAASF